MDEKIGCGDTVKKGRSVFLLGPPVALLYMADTMTDTVLTDLIVYRTCLSSLTINSTECSKLRTDTDSPEAAELEAKVEPYASMIVMTKSLIKSLLSVVICLFLGSWSDQMGRRPLLLAAASGYLLTFTTLSLMSNWDTNPWYLLLSLIPTNLAGGWSTVRLASVCYILATTAEKYRTLLLALLEVSKWGGSILGGLVAPPIYENYGYAHVFSTAAVCCGIALAWIYLFISESVKDSSKASIRGLFRISFVNDFVSSALLSRQSSDRCIIWLLIFALVSNNIINYVDILTIEFLFTRTRLGWDVREYSYFVVADSATCMIGLCGVSLRSRVPGATDTLLATIGMTSAMSAVIIKSLTWKGWHMYLSLCIGILRQVTVPAMQSIISQFVPPEEIGKVFSLVELLEVLGSLAGTPLYMFIYSHYLPPIYPSPVYLFSTSVWVLLTICIVYAEVLIRKSGKASTYISTAQEDF